MASMVVTLAAGGSVTFSSESIQTISNLFPTTSPAQLVSLSATEYAVIYPRTDLASGSDYYNGWVVQGLSINGTAVSYGTISTIVTQPCYNQFSTPNVYTQGIALGLSSTKLLFAYNAGTQTSGTFPSNNIIRIVPVEVGTAPGWTATWANSTTAASFAISTPPTSPHTSFPIGNDFTFVAYCGTNDTYVMIDNDYSLVYYSNSAVAGSATASVIGACPLYPVNNSAGYARAFSAYVDTTNNLKGLVLGIQGLGQYLLERQPQ